MTHECQPFPLATAVTGAVLLVVLVVGLAAGRTKGRVNSIPAPSRKSR